MNTIRLGQAAYTTRKWQYTRIYIGVNLANPDYPHTWAWINRLGGVSKGQYNDKGFPFGNSPSFCNRLILIKNPLIRLDIL